ncbi:Bro-N domain-containing protein [Endozoicomonas sp. Mp262]|uniref:BRO-N domain-containing protein n=1 Tax=Endozoicomonas sp. Mp262 TaxID=2919499 RepID=UPI0021D7E0CE
MMKALTVFNHEQFGNIRTLSDEEGNTWFVAKDVTDALGFRDAHNGIRGLDQDEKGTHIMSTPYGEQEVRIINESGLYACILKSRKPEAKKFKRWVTHDVLPGLRKNGYYGLSEGTPSRSTLHNPEPVHPAKALEAVTDYFKVTTESLPNLGETAKQALMATLTREIVGVECVPLPKLTEKFWTATELAAEFCISAQKLGRTANEHGLKCDDYGEFRISKSPHSDKQVQQFFYNGKGRSTLARLLCRTLSD